MDIRFINRRNEIINVSELSIKVIGSSLIGINAEQKIVEIERYESEEKAKEVLEGVAEVVTGNMVGEARGVVIDLRERKDGE